MKPSGAPNGTRERPWPSSRARSPASRAEPATAKPFAKQPVPRSLAAPLSWYARRDGAARCPRETPGQPMAEFRNFGEFYPLYLSEHSDRTCRRLHFIGSTIGLGLVAASVVTGTWWLFLLAVVTGYGF